MDGTLLSVPDCPANLAVFTRQRLGNGTSGYPQLRLAALVACGTRSVIGAVFAPATTGELEYARRLAGSLRAGVLLGDRSISAATLLNYLAATGADLLVRCKANRNLPTVARCRDGTVLTRIGPLTLRVIDAEITLRTARGTRLASPHHGPHRQTRDLQIQRTRTTIDRAALDTTEPALIERHCL